MPTDIQIEDDRILIIADNAPLGQRVVVRSTDLEVDGGKTRRVEQVNPARRAIVHDANDVLTLNYAGDYVNGVRVGGKPGSRSRLLLQIGNQKLPGAFGKVNPDPATEIDVLAELERLRNENKVIFEMLLQILAKI